MRARAFILGLLLAAGNALAAPGELDLLRQSGRVMEAGMTADMPPLSPGDPAWGTVPAALLKVYPQISTAPGFAEAAPATLQVQALAGKGHLALRLAWADSSENRFDLKNTDRFADAAAVQFPAKPGPRLPYIGMGEPNNPVSLWFWRAGTKPEQAGAQGFGTLATRRDARPEAEALRTADGWVVVLRAPIPTGAGSPLPLAFAMWDGATQGRDGRKWLSSWQILRLPGMRDDPARLRAWAVEAAVPGDALRGRKLAVERGCTACHHLPDGPAREIGPALLAAGGVHWPGYLRRSILQPSFFIVPGKNYGAKGISLMPDQKLSHTDAEDLTAYLSSLK